VSTILPPIEAVTPESTRAGEARKLVRLALPVVAGYLGTVAMGSVDVMMSGRLGAGVLAGVALGNTWAVGVAIVSWGAARALDPIVSQAYGARDHAAVGLGLSRGLVMGALLTLPMILLLSLAGPGLRLLGQPEELIGPAATYCKTLTIGVAPFMSFVVLRQFLQALGRMAAATKVVLAANVVNVFLNWVFLYGNLGAPRMGVAGCALATALAQWFMLVTLVWSVRDTLRGYWPGWQGTFDARPVGRMLRIGVPLGFQFALEVWAFHAAGLMMGRIGPVALAAHAVAINLATLSFMLPNGLAAAAATRVGNLIGAGHPWRGSAWIAVGLGAAVMTIPAAAFVLLPRTFASIYTPDEAVLSIAAVLLPLAGAFQLFDGTQVVCFGALRGAGDVHVPAVANAVGYWLLGLPAGYWLAFHAGWGGAGIWLGLVLGLAVVAGLLLARLAWIASTGGVRVRLEGA
jgi:MATE family multidrug resistance protein